MLVVAATAGLAWVAGCGDGATEPPPPDPPRPATVTVTPATAELTALGATVQLRAEVRDQNGQVMTGATVTWASGSADMATVDPTGLVTAAGNGTATITASAGGALGTAVVTVMQSPDSVGVLPAEATIGALGDTLRLAAEAFDANGRAVAGAEFSWESSDDAVAAVDGSGLVTAAANGTATITASAGEASGSAVVTVMQTVASVEVSPGTAEATALGASVQLTAEAFDANGHAVAGADFSWESSDARVATVDASGLVMGVAEGTATITANAGTATGSAIVTVTRTFTLSGTVSDSRRNGPVLAGAVVRLENGRQESMTTGPDGRYRFLNVRGTVTVTVTAEPSYVTETVEITVDEDRTLDFDLEHTGTPPDVGWTPRVVEPSDPTTLGSITYAGRGQRDVYDRRPDGWITIDAYLFNVRYAGQEVEFRVNPEFGSEEPARAEVETYAPALGQMPAVLRSAITHVVIHAGDELWGGGGDGILIHADGGKGYIADGSMEEVLVHEAAHSALDIAHKDSPGWRAAQAADGVFISEYARDHPDREDIAESFLPYLAVRYRPERLTDAERAVILTTIPNRLIYFDEQGFDMSPYERRGSVSSRQLRHEVKSGGNQPPAPPRRGRSAR